MLSQSRVVSWLWGRADVEVNQEVEYDPDVALVQELSARCEALALTEDLEKIIDDRVEETVSDEEPISDEEEVENNKNHIGDEVSTTTGDEPIFCEIFDQKTDEDCQEHTVCSYRYVTYLKNYYTSDRCSTKNDT